MVFLKGEIVPADFPYSNLLNYVERPVLLLTNLMGENYIMCKVTGSIDTNSQGYIISRKDLKSGTLRYKECKVEYMCLFYGHESLIASKTPFAKIKQSVLDKIILEVKALFD